MTYETDETVEWDGTALNTYEPGKWYKWTDDGLVPWDWLPEDSGTTTWIMDISFTCPGCDTILPGNPNYAMNYCPTCGMAFGPEQKKIVECLDEIRDQFQKLRKRLKGGE